MTRSKPIQKRSRDRVEKILLAAADELAKAGSADQLTTTSVSKRSGVPVSTIYRYFVDRSAIIAALIDRETEALDQVIQDELEALETISVETLLNTVVMTHFEYFMQNKRAIVLWFGTRQSKSVMDRVEFRYRTLGDWAIEGASAAGFLRSEYPRWGGEAVVWFCDRAFEFAFREKRGGAEERAILSEALQMVTTQINRYATERGKQGIPSADFLEQAESIPSALLFQEEST